MAPRLDASARREGTLTSVTFDLELLIGEASKYGIRRPERAGERGADWGSGRTGGGAVGRIFFCLFWGFWGLKGRLTGGWLWLCLDLSPKRPQREAWLWM